jgi:acyl dehydratase
MTTEIEKRWEWEFVEPGPTGEPFVSEVTPETIAAYARRVRNPNPAYTADSPGDLAMPTGIFNEAPLRRNSVATASGFVALEWVKENSRQTPFAKCEARWFAPIKAGDTIVSSARVLEKYERRGNKFVTFRVEAINQNAVKVAEYDYTCIFEYAKGQKSS